MQRKFIQIHLIYKIKNYMKTVTSFIYLTNYTQYKIFWLFTCGTFSSPFYFCCQFYLECIYGSIFTYIYKTLTMSATVVQWQWLTLIFVMSYLQERMFSNSLCQIICTQCYILHKLEVSVSLTFCFSFHFSSLVRSYIFRVQSFSVIRSCDFDTFLNSACVKIWHRRNATERILTNSRAENLGNYNHS